MHHYPHHIGDYRTHTAHLTMVEDGAYRRLIDIYYMNEFAFPADVATVQRLAAARTKEERTAVETILREFFILESDGWHQRRCDEEIATYQARANKARENGKSGGRPKTKNKPRNNQSGLSSDTQTEPEEKLTVNREPLTNSGSTEPARAQEASDHERPIKLPPDWRPPTACRDYAVDKGLDPQSVTEAFTDYFAGGKGRNEKRTSAGWEKRWRVWCNTDAERKSPARGGGGFRSAGDGGDVGAFARAAARLGRNEPVQR